MERKSFGTTRDGKAVEQIKLTSPSGASVSILTYGATVTNLIVPDRAGKLADVTLGFDDIAGYESSNNPFFGATVGRVANRIAKGTYTVDGVVYHSALNNGANTLHGGLKAYDKRIWDVQDVSDSSAKFSLLDPDGSEGFPGNVKVELTYTFTANHVLRIEYKATTDKATPINLTNHSYFNLKDGGNSSVAGHILKLHAEAYIPVNGTLIPTGRIAPVKGTAIDFTQPKPIGQDLLAMGGQPAGYDHCLVLARQKRELSKAAEVYEPATGRIMEVWTTEVGMQFYSSNFLAGTFEGKNHTRYSHHSAFCFETQDFPDAINQPTFPSTILRPGKIYHHLTEYRFGAASTQPF